MADSVRPSIEPSPSTSPTIPSLPPAVKKPTSSQARIDSILDAARRRSIAIAASGQPLPMSVSPRQSSARLSEHDGNVGDGAESSSADEQTAIIRRENSRRIDYQSTSISVRSRNSDSITRRSIQERAPQSSPPDPTTPPRPSWWKAQVEKLGSIELENKGSVARDHLALERTFLAWLRTSLAFASIGIAITQLFRLNTTLANSSETDTDDDPYLHLRQLGKPLGATFLGISILVLFIGFHRYFESQHWIVRGKFPASRGSIAFVATIALALMVTSLVVVLVVEPTAFEKRRR